MKNLIYALFNINIQEDLQEFSHKYFELEASKKILEIEKVQNFIKARKIEYVNNIVVSRIVIYFEKFETPEDIIKAIEEIKNLL